MAILASPHSPLKLPSQQIQRWWKQRVGSKPFRELQQLGWKKPIPNQ